MTVNANFMRIVKELVINKETIPVGAMAQIVGDYILFMFKGRMLTRIVNNQPNRLFIRTKSKYFLFKG